MAFLAALALLVMLIGLIGTFVPGVPGVPLVWLAAAAFALLDRFHQLGLFSFLSITLLGIVGTTAGIWGSQLLARATGGSGRSAAAGTCLAALGLIFFTVPIALLLALAGVFGIEFKRRRDAKLATLSSAGWLVGWLLTAVIEFVIALVMIVIFVTSLLPTEAS